MAETVKGGSRGRYEPGPAFEENEEEAVLDISLTNSTELWLIQWPKGQVQASDFHGQELSLMLHHDGNLGSLESSSGKSYELVSFAAQEPDATVFLPSGAETKAVGKIARRVCLVRYPEPEEFKKSAYDTSQKTAGSSGKSTSRLPGISKPWSSQGSALSLGQESTEPTPKQKHKRKDRSTLVHSDVPGKSTGGSHASTGVESNATSEIMQAMPEKSKKKKKVKIEE